MQHRKLNDSSKGYTHVCHMTTKAMIRLTDSTGYSGIDLWNLQKITMRSPEFQLKNHISKYNQPITIEMTLETSFAALNV